MGRHRGILPSTLRDGQEQPAHPVMGSQEGKESARLVAVQVIIQQEAVPLLAGAQHCRVLHGIPKKKIRGCGSSSGRSTSRLGALSPASPPLTVSEGMVSSAAGSKPSCTPAASSWTVGFRECTADPGML